MGRFFPVMEVLYLAKSVAILLDGGFILKKLPKDSCNCNSVYSFALSCFKTTEEELFRIFFYHCSPYDGVQTHPITHARIDFSQTSVAIQMRELVEELRVFILSILRL